MENISFVFEELKINLYLGQTRIDESNNLRNDLKLSIQGVANPRTFDD